MLLNAFLISTNLLSASYVPDACRDMKQTFIPKNVRVRKVARACNAAFHYHVTNMCCRRVHRMCANPEKGDLADLGGIKSRQASQRSDD